ncbi:MAG TPA: hypothetical protein VFW52_00260 [Candidatus Saccharimonadales bacterium]|nr:hypothetical protein [Candidatus Saccharimonadales bacterium]
MATPELAPGEAYDVDGILIEGDWEDGECSIITTAEGWKTRSVDVDIDEHGAHIDGLEFEQMVPEEEKLLVFRAVAKFIRIAYPEINDIEDPDGNLL